MKIHDPTFKKGDIVEFLGSTSDVICRSSIGRQYEHISIPRESLGVIVFIELQRQLDTQWYGILVSGRIVWISVLTQGIILRRACAD